MIFPPNALLYDTEITLTATSEIAKTYPNEPEFLEAYPIDSLKFLSPQLIVELATDALDWRTDEILKELIRFSLGLYKGISREGVWITGELRTKINSGEVDLHFIY